MAGISVDDKKILDNLVRGEYYEGLGTYVGIGTAVFHDPEPFTTGKVAYYLFVEGERGERRIRLPASSAIERLRKIQT